MNHSMSNRGIISPNEVARVECYLDPQEVYSMIFLLYEDVETAFQEIHLESTSPRRTAYVLDSAVFRSSNTENGILVRWARNSMNRDKYWQDKFLEALLLIKNYMCVTKVLEKSRRDLDLKFTPSDLNKSHHVNLLRKILFLMVEDLSIAQWKYLLKLMTDEARYMGIEVPSEYLNVPEIFLLFLLSRNILTTGKDKKVNFQFLCRCLRKADYFYWAKNLQNVEDLLNNKGSSVLPKKSNDKEIPRFNLDSVNQGTVLIFNQEDYGGKTRKNVKLGFREGSKLDCIKLERTFQLLNFFVDVFENTSSQEMLGEIRKSVKKFCSNFEKNKKERCFAVVILAHGDQDEIVCTGEEDVLWEEIRKELRNSDMEGLPRLFLSQACKGISQVSQTARGLEVVQDGCGNLRELFEFHSCVSGFAAYRSKQFGSFFITSLCKHLLKYGGVKSIAQIATLVVADLEVCDVKCDGRRVSMIPEVTSTLSKDLFLALPEVDEAEKLVDKWEKEIESQTAIWKEQNKKSYEKTLSCVHDQNQCPNLRGRHQPLKGTPVVTPELVDEFEKTLRELISKSKDQL